MTSTTSTSLYNPDWLSDDDLVAGFVARLELFDFLRGELRRAPVRGTTQHYLLVGVRGSGKTTMLQRLAVAVRRDADLRDHLLAVSFPEELYQVKHLADFWWAACEALADTLDREGRRAEAETLFDEVESRSRLLAPGQEHDEAGLRCLMATSARLGRRPVLFVDNLDLVLRRIDKRGKKRKDPDSRAYWALREALSRAESPLVIGGSVRLSEPFVGSDKPFYDFFLPKRLATLSLDEVRTVLQRLAEGTGDAELVARVAAGGGRIRALHDLTGGNPRALGLVFQLIREGPTSRAVDDFEQLLDLTTPYYKARFENLAEQAQAVLHALATITRDEEAGLATAEGTAAVVARRVGLDTRLVSAQLEHLVNKGVVLKHSPDKGRNRYRVAEQLFRLWIQMRTSRRLRMKVVGLAEYLEALWDRDELERSARTDADGTPTPGRAKLEMALAMTARDDGFRRSHEGRAVDTVLRIGDGRAALLARLSDPATAPDAAAEIRAGWDAEQRELLRDGLEDADVERLYSARERGSLRRSGLTPGEAEEARSTRGLLGWRSFLWRLLAARCVPLRDDIGAGAWLAWGKEHFADAPAEEWAAVARAFRRAGRLELAEAAVEVAFSRGECARGWYERGALLDNARHDRSGAEAAYRRAIELDPDYALAWNNLGVDLSRDPARGAEMEAAYRRAIELDPNFAVAWSNLGLLLARDPARGGELEAALARAVELDPGDTHAVAELARLGLRRQIHSVQAAVAAGDWEEVASRLREGLADEERGRALLTAPDFVRGVVGRAVDDGSGGRLLALLRDLGADRSADPLLLALDAALDDATAKLRRAPPEMRAAALHLYGLILEPEGDTG